MHLCPCPRCRRHVHAGHTCPFCGMGVPFSGFAGGSLPFDQQNMVAGYAPPPPAQSAVYAPPPYVEPVLPVPQETLGHAAQSKIASFFFTSAGPRLDRIYVAAGALLATVIAVPVWLISRKKSS